MTIDKVFTDWTMLAPTFVGAMSIIIHRVEFKCMVSIIECVVGVIGECIAISRETVVSSWWCGIGQVDKTVLDRCFVGIC